jgi:hypothetical protein
VGKLDKIHEYMTGPLRTGQGEFDPRIKGDQVICIRVKNLRRLAELPENVEIIKLLSFPRPRNYYDVPDDWIPQPREIPVYLHIQHPFCVRCPPGGVMAIEDFDEFLKRFKELESQYGPL